MESLYGTGVALITPFKEDLSIDTAALKAVVDHCIRGGVDYLVVLGTTGESVTLSRSEKQLVMRTVEEANDGRLPLVLGIGGNNTEEVANEFKATNLEAYAAVLSVSPYYNRPTQEGIYRHFARLAQVSSKPIIVYNVPARTGSNMLPDTTLRLARDFDNIIGIKEACGDMEQVKQLLHDKPEGFLIISGDDATALPTVLAGGAGVISVIGQGIPAAFSRMIQLGLDREDDAAWELHNLMTDGIDLIFKEGNPAGIKAMLNSFGLCTSRVRLPLVEASEPLASRIETFGAEMTATGRNSGA